MAYATALVVGALCGVAGVTTVSIADHALPARQAIAPTPVPVVVRSAVPVLTPAVDDDLHMPPARVPIELVGG